MFHHSRAVMREDNLAPSSPFRIFRTSLNAFPLHWHSCVEIIHINSGRLSCRINEERYRLKEGDILFINSGDLHAFTPGPDEQNDLVLIQVEPSFFSRTVISVEFSQSPAAVIGKRKLFSRGDQGYREVSRHIRRIIDESSGSDESSAIAVSAAFLDIFLFFYRLKSPARSAAGQSAAYEKLRKALDYISGNYMNCIKLEDAAAAACLSPYHFSRTFKRLSGQTFTEYLKAYRIKCACNLLVSTDEPVTEIAYLCGFSNLKTFYRQFKSVEGASPGNFRERFYRSS